MATLGGIYSEVKQQWKIKYNLESNFDNIVFFKRTKKETCSTESNLNHSCFLIPFKQTQYNFACTVQTNQKLIC